MKIIYFILAHKAPEQLKKLVNQLSGENVKIYIHIDKASDYLEFEKALKDILNITILSTQRVYWGEISMVNATLDLINSAYNAGELRGEGYCVLLSGQDFPIKPKAYIYTFFIQNYGKEYIDLHKLPYSGWEDGGMNRVEAFTLKLKEKVFVIYPLRHLFFFKSTNIKQVLRCIYTSIKANRVIYCLKKVFSKRKRPGDISMYGGSQWWALTFETVKAINFFLERNSEYIKFHQDTLIPDEIFFHSLVPLLVDKEKLHKSITYAAWNKSYNGNSPGILTEEDIHVLVRKQALFARKFDMNKNPKILDTVVKVLLEEKESK